MERHPRLTFTLAPEQLGRGVSILAELTPARAERSGAVDLAGYVA